MVRGAQTVTAAAREERHKASGGARLIDQQVQAAASAGVQTAPWQQFSVR